MKYTVGDWGKGLNLDLLPSELAPGFCSSATNVRFRNGFAERVNGIANTDASFLKPYYWLSLYQTPAAATYGCYMVYVADTLVYAWDLASTHTPITPQSAGVDVPFTSNLSAPNPQMYTGGPFNGVFLFNSPADGLYYWTGDTATNLALIPNSYVARVSRPFGNYIVQLAPTMSGTEYPRRVLWSSATEPGSIPSAFAASSTNDAGLVDLAEGGEVVDCLPLGDALIIYTTDARWAMRYVGGNQVFSFDKLSGNDGLLYRGCVTDTPVGHVFLSSSLSVLLHSGGDCRNLSAGRVSRFFTDNYSSNITRSFLFRHQSKNEVWVCVPGASAVANYCDKILLWNWVDDTWGTKTLTDHGLTGATSGIAGTNIAYELSYVAAVDSGGTTGRIGTVESDKRDFNKVSADSSVVEITGLTLGDRDQIKNLQRSRLNFDYKTGATYTVQVQHGSSMSADVAPTYTSAVTYTPGTTDYCNARATGGRFLAIKVTWSAEVSPTGNRVMEDSGKLRSCDIDVTTGGRR